ncbi:S-adenosylmethionine decarboxylase proenzyme [Patellaria atrata CBS 101060]|uniref:adenosylmethionine decarboxylase n=1 Tax=Patellaria atrata CBS 101060 TaxID=1346257 RepID=A0A9P4SEK2_9PEZI|nr:S-adenosylmethionine decarboxylase proenzyme [Patellaria atrata CBS 101060]
MPHLQINHEATVDLDSTNAFEGPEKLLEVWFSPTPDSLPANVGPLGLKKVPAETWNEVLDLVNCKVLSIVRSETVDAYLLSESSMFVFPHKLVLKTCGTTTLLLGLPRMLEIAALVAGFPHTVANYAKKIPAYATPYRVFYSRKNFLHPDRQRGPHRSWREEVQFLDNIFLGGSAYMIGKMNGEHWYLYITEPDTRLSPPGTPDSERSETETRFLNFPSGMAVGSSPEGNQDETLELLMTDLDETNARQFYLKDASALAKARLVEGDDLPEELTTEGHALGTVVSKECGLSDVYPTNKYPDARVDAYLFTPCGFSANGVIPGTTDTDGHYFTVHVTPEPHCSFASFETNVPAAQTGRETSDIVEQVVNIFRPGRFSVTLFEAKPGSGEGGIRGYGDAEFESRQLAQAPKHSSRMETIKGYRRVDRIVHDLDGYDLVFRYFERLDWRGGSPRLGEYGGWGM